MAFTLIELLGLQQARFFDVKIKKLEMAMNIG